MPSQASTRHGHPRPSLAFADGLAPETRTLDQRSPIMAFPDPIAAPAADPSHEIQALRRQVSRLEDLAARILTRLESADPPLTVTDFARRIGQTERKVREMIANGEVETLAIPGSRSVRIAASEAEYGWYDAAPAARRACIPVADLAAQARGSRHCPRTGTHQYRLPHALFAKVRVRPPEQS